MPDPVTASAHVATTTAPRYAKQLASHLGRRCEVREEPDGIRLVLDAGECLLRPGPAGLDLDARAADDRQLAVVTHVVGSHLERFGQRKELVVTWVAAGPK